MCGICSYLGFGLAFNYGYTGIKKLLNRGYDSIGITSIGANSNFITHKYASTDDDMAHVKLELSRDVHNNDNRGICICHSRWRTVGDKTDINSHPHMDSFGFCNLVHNGIIENYMELKNELISEGYGFVSETDSEVIVNLISFYYIKNNDMTIAIKKALLDIKGTYALCILCKDTPDIIYCICNGCPLLIGHGMDEYGDNFLMAVSEKYGFDENITNYFVMESNELILLSKNIENIENIENKKKCDGSSNCVYVLDSFFNEKQCKWKKFEYENGIDSPYPYNHWTIKEIVCQSESCHNTIEGRIIETYDKVHLPELDKNKYRILTCNHLIILGCGTSYNAGLTTISAFRPYFKTVQVIDAGQFHEEFIPHDKKETCFIFISQSGETKDLHRCLELCVGHMIIGVINVEDSLIAREVDSCVYLKCGREFAVASTKAYSSQIIVLILISMWFSQNNNYVISNNRLYIKKLSNIGCDVKIEIEKNTNICKNIAEYLSKKNSMFLLGKETFEAVAKEGALKLKEIGYIHAEGYDSSALKHGSYALLDNGFPVILLIPNDRNYTKNQGILDELISRGAYVIGISDHNLDETKYSQSIIIKQGSYTELLMCTMLQLIAYYLSLSKKINPDYPRNLSKTVSVD